MSESWLMKLLGATAKVTVRFEATESKDATEKPQADSEKHPDALQNTAVPAHWRADTTSEPSVYQWPKIAGYEILAELGRGGMGVVYLARHCGLGRPVALKMIHAHVAAQDEAAQRFRTEVEAAARLHHPNIVQIYDVGLWNDLPYFCMEYMEGGSLDGHLQRRPQPPKAAARMVEILALAAHHAHLRGIVHRDLKPSNILLSRDGVPKISDFGLAKQLEQAGTTKTGEVMGTPSYMSPEQTASENRNVGPAADIYSLGAILYEMLTGRPPFLGSNVLETVLLVRFQDPVPPRRMQPGIPKDLETICLKCLEKSPSRRYPTAAALAEDLRRFQAGEPILARPSTMLERAWKWSQRRPAVAALLATLFLALVSLLGLGTYHVRSVEQERQRAEENHQLALAEARFAQEQKAEADRKRAEAQFLQKLAEANYKLARQGVEEILSTVRENPDLQNPENEALRKALTQKALTFYRSLIAQAAQDPHLREEEARACWRVADCLDDVGDRAESIQYYERATRLFTDLAQKHPDQPEYRFLAAQTTISLGYVHSVMGQFKEAIPLWERAEQVLRSLLATEPDNIEYLHVLAKAFANLGRVRSLLGQRREAEEALLRALGIDRALALRKPDDERFPLQLSHDLNLLGKHAWQNGRFAEAEAAFQESLLLDHELAAKHPNSQFYALRLAQSISALGSLHRQLGYLALAEAELREALDILERLSERAHPSPVILTTQANVLSELGLTFWHRKETEAALTCLQKSSALYLEVIRRHHDSLDHRVNLAGTYCNQAGVLIDKGEYSASLDMFGQAEKLLVPVLQQRPQHKPARVFLRNVHWNRANLHAKQRRWSEALKDYDWAMAVNAAEGQGIPNELVLERALVLVHLHRCDAALRDTESVLASSAGLNPHNLYQAALVFALAATSCPRSDAETSGLYREALSRRAVQLLMEAAEMGYFTAGLHPKHRLLVPELEVLRDRADFRELCRRLQVPL